MSMDSETAKRMHDLLLSIKPLASHHEASLCAVCEVAVDGAASRADNTDPQGGDMSNKTYTEDELQAEIAGLRNELDEIKASQEQAAIEARITELTESHEAQVAELQAQLDTATAAAEATKQQYEELVAFLDQEAAAAAAEEALKARREEIKTLVSDYFNEEHIEANLDRWASLDVDVLDALVEDWKAAAAAAAKPAVDEEEGGPDLTSSAMQAGLDQDSSQQDVADIRRSLHRQRHAIRTVGSRSA